MTGWRGFVREQKAGTECQPEGCFAAKLVKTATLCILGDTGLVCKVLGIFAPYVYSYL